MTFLPLLAGKAEKPGARVKNNSKVNTGNKKAQHPFGLDGYTLESKGLTQWPNDKIDILLTIKGAHNEAY